MIEGMAWTETLARLPLDGRAVRCVLRRPAQASARPAMLVNLAMDAVTSLGEPPYRIVPDVFLEAGHAVASFDLPCHGEDVRDGMEGLTGLAASMAAGVDEFARLREAGRAVIAWALEMLPAGTGVVVSGTSRGGLACLHLMAAEPHIAAGAVLAPVTHLPALREFAALADRPLVAAASAESLLPKLAGRPVYVAINRVDPRVGAEHCLRFVEQLRAGSATQVTLDVTPDESHRVPDRCYRDAAEFLLRHV